MLFLPQTSSHLLSQLFCDSFGRCSLVCRINLQNLMKSVSGHTWYKLDITQLYQPNMAVSSNTTGERLDRISHLFDYISKING